MFDGKGKLLVQLFSEARPRPLPEIRPLPNSGALLFAVSFVAHKAVCGLYRSLCTLGSVNKLAAGRAGCATATSSRIPKVRLARSFYFNFAGGLIIMRAASLALAGILLPASAAFAAEPMAPTDIQATFFGGKPFTASTTSGT